MKTAAVEKNSQEWKSGNRNCNFDMLLSIASEKLNQNVFPL